MHYRIPVLRRVLETAGVFDLGLDPVEVTNALRLLRGDGAYMKNKRCSIVHTSVRLSREAKPSNIYTFNRRPANAEDDALRELYRKRESAFESVARTVGACNEQDHVGCVHAFSAFRHVGRG